MNDVRLPARGRLLIAGTALLSAAIAWWGIDRLEHERGRLGNLRAMAEAGAHPSTPLMKRGMAFEDADRPAAIARFERRLSEATAGHRLLVEKIETLRLQRDQSALLAAEISVSGSERDIRRFVSTVESGIPVIRFGSWRIARTATGESSVRIEARAIALWDPDA